MNSVDYQKKFALALNEKKLENLQHVVFEWRASLPDDPEGYVAAFNYYLILANLSELIASDEVQLLTEESIDKQYQMADSAISIIQKGIQKFPNRLDFHFGYAFVLGTIGAWYDLRKECLYILEESQNRQFSNWIWSQNEPVLSEAKTLVVESVTDYLFMLYQTDIEEKWAFIDELATLNRAIYPDHFETIYLLFLVNKEKGDEVNTYKWIEKAILLEQTEPTVNEAFYQALIQLKGERKGKKMLLKWKKSSDQNKKNVAHLFL